MKSHSLPRGPVSHWMGWSGSALVRSMKSLLLAVTGIIEAETFGRLPVFRWKPVTAHYSLGLDAALPGPPEAQAPRTPATPVIGPEGSRSNWRSMRYTPSKPSRSLPECSKSNPSSEYHPGTSISSITCPTCSTCRRTPRVSTLQVSGWMQVWLIIPPPYPMSARPGKWRRGEGRPRRAQLYSSASQQTSRLTTRRPRTAADSPTDRARTAVAGCLTHRLEQVGQHGSNLDLREPAVIHPATIILRRIPLTIGKSATASRSGAPD